MVSCERISLPLWFAAALLCGCSPVVVGGSPDAGTGGASGSGGDSVAPPALWNRRFGENDSDNGDGPFGNHGAYAFALDSQGAAIIGGGSIGSIDFGDGEIPAASNAFIAKLGPNP